MTNANGASNRSRVALVGAGYIASYHLKAIRALGTADVVGVCDLSMTRAENFAKANWIDGAFTDIGKMVESTGADAVHVLTPPNAHLQPGVAVLEAGADLLMEKPMCTTSADCKALEAAAKKTGQALGISHNFLFNDPYERFMADLSQGDFGELDLVEIVKLETRPKRVRDRTELQRDQLRLRHNIAAPVQEGRRTVLRLAHDRRVRGADQFRTHLMSARQKSAGDHRLIDV